MVGASRKQFWIDMERHEDITWMPENGLAPEATAREQDRLVALRLTGLLDTPPEPAFDRLTRLAARLLGAPVALVSLIDERRQFLKSGIGLPEPLASRRETRRADSVCQHLVTSGQPLVVPDARVHPLARTSPPITELGLVACLAMPLRVEGGHVLGGLCVLDYQPRAWTDEQIATAQDLAGAVVSEIELRLATRAARQQATEAARARAETEATQKRLAGVLDRIGDGFLMLDATWRLTYVNQGIERTTGRDRAALLGKDFWAVFPPALGGAMRVHYERAVADRAPVQFEAFEPERGRWFSIHAYPAGEGLAVTYLDVTARRQGEEATRFLSEATTALSASLDDEVILTRLADLATPMLGDLSLVSILGEDGVPRRVALAAVNPHRAAVVREIDARYPLDPAISTGIGRVIRAGEPLYLPEVSDAVLEAAARDEDHLALLRRAGLVSYMIVPLTSHERCFGALALGITESARRYTKADLMLAVELGRRAALAVENARLYQSAHEAARQREAFLSIASHELRTPLTTVKAGVQLLARYAGKSGWQEPRTRRLLQQVQDQLRRLEGLMNDLLDASRIQQGRLELRPERTDLSALAGLVMGRFQQELEDAGCHRLTLDAPEPVVGLWDAARLDQVLTNLLSNAIKYSPQGGEVRVIVRQDDEWAEATVRDQGIGIPPAEQRALFEPFARGEALSQRVGGVGLGLYITARIVEQHGGTIRLESAPGQGSAFTVRLPLQPRGQEGHQEG